MSPHAPLHLNSDVLEASVLPMGAALSALRFAGAARSKVLSFANPADHDAVDGCAGTIVGPVANRIRGGRITLDGVTHQMPCNENGVTSLHSGPAGLHRLAWEIETHSDSRVMLRIALKDGAQGLPGNREIRAIYALEGNVLSLELSATTDRTTAMNLAHHPYWNLDGQADISGHHLHIEAEHYLPTDAANLPTGDRIPMRGSAFDFAAMCPVPLDPALDVNFCLADAPRAVPQHAARLTGADGTTLEIETTAPGLQVYSGAHLPTLPGALDGGADLGPFAGLAIEPQFWPDAPHHPDFPQITLHPGDTWRQVTRYIMTRPR